MLHLWLPYDKPKAKASTTQVTNMHWYLGAAPRVTLISVKACVCQQLHFSS